MRYFFLLLLLVAQFNASGYNVHDPPINHAQKIPTSINTESNECNESVLYYNRFRYYSPDEGMYLSQDPIGLEGGFVLYGYVKDVNSWVDIFGLSGIGGTVHQGIQKKLLGDLGGKGHVVREGQIALGNGSSRFGDVVVYADSSRSKILEVHQIGDMRTRGGFTPSSRERGAIMDIRQKLGNDVKIVYHDKKGRVTLINPDLDTKNWKAPSDKHRKLKGGCN